MINPDDFIRALEASDIRFAAGVPDSLLKDVCAAITTRFPEDRHIIAANEGSAVGLAIGHYLASRRPALVYMQNSGLGNSVNPLASLADPAIYGIPMILMIGWRGEMLDGVQIKDEPQHVTQGRITLDQLAVLGIPFRVIDAGTDIDACLRDCAELALSEMRPVAIVVRKQAFSSFRLNDQRADENLPTREQVIAAIVDALPGNVPVVSTTGMPSRELFELRKAGAAGHHRDFLTVGGMGHAVSIASGIALARPQGKVVCLDGDGAMLMHMGALSNSAQRSNLVHIVLNNGAHDSVGGQPTQALHLKLADIARCCGYGRVMQAAGTEEVASAIGEILSRSGSSFLEIRCRRGARADLARPDRSPSENRRDFMAFLEGAKS